MIDDELSSSSTNPVQNKVVNTALANKADIKDFDESDNKINTFTEATTDYPVPEVGDTFKVIMGKVIKWFTDIKNVLGIGTSLTTTAKTIIPAINELNSNTSGGSGMPRTTYVDISAYNSSSNLYTAPYDGWCSGQVFVSSNTSYALLTIINTTNGFNVRSYAKYSENAGFNAFIPVKKGQKIYYTTNNNADSVHLPILLFYKAE